MRATTGTITGKSFGLAVTSTAADLVVNAAASDNLYRVISVIIANVDGTNADTVDVTLVKSVGASPVTTHLAKGVSVAAGVSVDVLVAPIYLEEDDKIQVAGAAASGDLEAIVVYEIIA